MANMDPSKLQEYLRGMDYPANKQALLDKARENNAGDEEIALLGGLPDKEYGGPDEVMSAMKDAETYEGDDTEESSE